LAIQTPPNTQTTEPKEMGRGGALIESITFHRRVVGSTPALTTT